MATKIDSGSPVVPKAPTDTASAQQADATAPATTATPPADAKPAKKAKPAGWIPQDTKPSDPGKPDEYRTLRLARVGKTVSTLTADFNELKKTVTSGLDVSKTAGTLLKGLEPDQAKLVLDAAKQVAGRKVATELMTSWGATMAKFGLSQPERTLAMGKVTDKALQDGTAAAAKYLSKYVDANAATKIAASIGKSKLTTEALATATKAGSVMKWVGVAAHGLTGVMAAYDVGKAIQTQRDPKATTTQKVAGWLTAAGDAAMFVPFPPVEIAGAAVSVVGSLFRDSQHPIKDVGDWLATKAQAVSTLFGGSTPQPAPAQ